VNPRVSARVRRAVAVGLVAAIMGLLAACTNDNGGAIDTSNATTTTSTTR